MSKTAHRVSGNVRFVQVNKEQKKRVDNQTDTKSVNGSEQSPLISRPIDPETLFQVYDNSFLISGIINKISSSANTGFEKIDNKDLAAIVDRLDVKTSILNLGIFGNIFYEKVMKRGGGVYGFKPIVTTSIKIKGDRTYQQRAGGKTIDFEDGEICQVKLPGVGNSYYGDSLFSGCVQQIVLLQHIDKYYKELFERGLFNPVLLTDKNNNMSDKAQEKLQAAIQDQFRGTENLQAIGILPGDFGIVELVKNMDTKAFLEYREHIIKSIAMSMNISYSMLVNDNSNKATSSTEYDVFLKEIVKPLQKMFLDQLKMFLFDTGEFNEKDLAQIEFKTVDTKNEKEQMETRKGYVDAGIVTPNEARTILGYGAIDGGDVIRTRITPEQSQQQLDEIEKKVANIYK